MNIFLQRKATRRKEYMDKLRSIWFLLAVFFHFGRYHTCLYLLGHIGHIIGWLWNTWSFYILLNFYLSWPDKWMSLLIFKIFTQISKTGLSYFVITVLNKPWTRKQINRKEKNIKLVHHLLSRIQIRKPKDLEVFLKW